MTTQGTLALQSAQFIERMKALRAQEIEFVDIVSEVTADIKLGSLLQKVMGEATRMLNAERSTLFLNDEKTDELWSEVGQGLEVDADPPAQPRRASPAPSSRPARRSTSPTPTPTCASTRRSTRRPGSSRARSCACPIVNKHGKIIGVTQVLNKRGGPFTQRRRVAAARRSPRRSPSRSKTPSCSPTCRT